MIRRARAGDIYTPEEIKVMGKFLPIIMAPQSERDEARRVARYWYLRALKAEKELAAQAKPPVKIARWMSDAWNKVW